MAAQPMNVATGQAKPLAWNDEAIIAAMGRAPDAVKDLLGRHDQPIPTDMAVYQWVSRKKLPDKWRPRLIYALLRESRIDIGKLFKITGKA